MPVDAAIQAVLSTMAEAGGPTLSEMPIADARMMRATLSALDGEPEPVGTTDDRTIAGVPVRIYRAEGTAATAAPCLVWYHGGGWVIGDLASADTTARKLANRTGAVVVSVDYRLAPEHRFPAAADDCLAVLEAVVGDVAALGIDPQRVAIGGDSAGGNLSAVVAIAARDSGIDLRHQLLVYPVTDLTMSHASYTANGEGYLLTTDGMAWFIAHYLGDHEPKDPKASPLYTDRVAGVAPATVITAEFDPLRDEGAAYADRLRDEGVAVEYRCYDGMIHGFFGMGSLTPIAGEAVDWAGARLRDAL